MSSTPIKDVSGTAFVVAEFRAEENSEATPLYRDHVVELFLSDESRHAAGRVAGRFPPVKDMVKVRTRYYDDMLEQQLRSQCRQVVILGAGLDTRAVRKQTTGVRYFEIDDPATLRWKQACYGQRGVAVEDVAFIPGNYVSDGVIALLKANGFDFELPTYFIWEGNVMYLPIESVKHTLAELRRCVARFQISFDYMSEAVITHTTGDPDITTLVDTFASIGAPWISGIRDIHDFTREMQLRLIENFKTAALFQTYRLDRAMRSAIFNFYSVCTLAR
jgi:methyltransferase (TIGR00027 family)